MWRQLGVVSALAMIAGCGKTREPPPPTVAPAPPRTTCCTDVFIVAHADDDLLFMNPDIQASIDRGDDVTVIVLTASDVYAPDSSAGACGTPAHDDPTQYWLDRERGSLNAYTYMTGRPSLSAYSPLPAIPDDWRLVADPGHVSIRVDGLDLVQYRLATPRQTVSLVFFRLADSQLQCLWNNTPGCLPIGFHPDRTTPPPDDLSWARGHCSSSTTQSCATFLQCPPGEACTAIPHRLADGSCADCDPRAPTYFAYTLPCASGARRHCKKGHGPCTDCSSTASGDQCPLGTALPEQRVASRDQLVAILGDLLLRLHPTSVAMLDASNLHMDLLGVPSGRDEPGNELLGYSENWNHYFAALFALAATTRAQAATTAHIGLAMYRGYTITREPANVPAGAAPLQKKRTFARYAMFDNQRSLGPGGLDSPAFRNPNYDEDWPSRMYATRSVGGDAALQGRLRVAAHGGACVAASGTALTLVACDAAPVWTLTPENQLELAGSGQCLAVSASGGHTLNPGVTNRATPLPAEPVVLAPCEQRASSTLFVMANGQVRTPGARCLESDGATAVVSSDCKQWCKTKLGNVLEDVYCFGVTPGAYHAQDVPPPDQSWELVSAGVR